MATVSQLSLESYVQIHKALTKNGDKVQTVTPIEECYYKVQDLRQLLSIHGLSATKFNRTELLQALKGKPLVNPVNAVTEPPDALEQQQPAAKSTTEGCSKGTAADTSTASTVSITGAELNSIGWAEAGADVLAKPLQQLQIDLLAGFDDIPMLDPDDDAADAVAVDVIPADAHSLQPQQQQQIIPHPVGGDVYHRQGLEQQSRKQGASATSIAVQQLRACAAVDLVAAAQAQQDGWRTAKRARTDDKNPGAAAEQLETAASGALAVHAAAPSTLVAGQQQRTTAATAAAAVVRSLQQQLAVAVGRTHVTIAAEPTHVQQGPHSTHPCAGSMLMPISVPAAAADAGAYALQHHQQLHQIQADQEDSADETEAEDDYQSSPASILPTAVRTPAPVDPLVKLLQDADLYNTQQPPDYQHTPWLLQQLQLFAAGGAVASQEVLPTAPAAAGGGLVGSGCGGGGVLLGRHVGFVLTDDMPVAGLKNAQLTLPAGVYEGRVVKYLGTGCQPEICEPTCPGQHQHYRATIIPPQLPDTGCVKLLHAQALADSVAQAHAAATGRPVQLILDLHQQLRCSSFRNMLSLDEVQLQDAWMLLKEEEQQPSTSPEPTQEAPVPAAAATAQAGKGQPKGARAAGSKKSSQSAAARAPQSKRAKR